MKRDLIITSNTAQLSLLRYQNSCLDEFLKTAPRNRVCDCLIGLNHSVSQLTNLFTKEISDAFGPIVDFKRISRNVMGNMPEMLLLNN